MRDITPFWFTPKTQPDPAAPVDFQLRPLDLRTYFVFQRSIASPDAATEFDGLAAAFNHGCIGWRNLRDDDGAPLDFSPEAKRRVLEGLGSPHWMLWLGEISVELNRRAQLTETERKNS